MSFPSMAHLFHARVEQTPDQLAFQYRDRGVWQDLSWGGVAAQVREISCGLHDLGLEKGDRCGILSATRIEWILADLGILCGGYAATTVYPSNTVEECAYILGHAECRVCFAENAAQVAKLREKRTELPKLFAVIVIEGSSSEDGWVISLEALREAGRRRAAGAPEEYRARADAIGPEDLATLIYTSGTTGPPKGVMLVHDCWVFEAESVREELAPFFQPDDKQYLFLPLAHSFGKVLEIVAIHVGLPTAVEGDIAYIVQGLSEVEPTFMAAVPRVFEKIFNTIVTRAKAAGPFRYRVFRWALRTGVRWTEVTSRGEVPRRRLRLQHAIADRLVFRKIRDRLGGRLRYFVSGGAPLEPEIAKFFFACGIFIGEGYGLTETSAGSVANRLDDFRFGTVGKPGLGVGVKIAEDGEIWISGRGVMRGYYKDPRRTREVLGSDGWFRTGDLGAFDSEGFLKITGRIKDLIITAGGKNIAPSRIENAIKARSPLIGEVVMHGDRRNFCVALVSLDPEAVDAWAQRTGLAAKSLADWSADPALHDAVWSEIAAVNRTLARYETIKKIHLLDHPLSIESGELTPSHKVKRRVIEENYRAILDGFYDGTVMEV